MSETESGAVFAYYQSFREAVQACETRAQLVDLWKSHEAARKRWRIQQGDADYQRLVLICTERNADLKAREAP
jgi:hypothetical protein